MISEGADPLEDKGHEFWVQVCPRRAVSGGRHQRDRYALASGFLNELALSAPAMSARDGDDGGRWCGGRTVLGAWGLGVPRGDAMEIYSPGNNQVTGGLELLTVTDSDAAACRKIGPRTLGTNAMESPGRTRIPNRERGIHGGRRRRRY